MERKRTNLWARSGPEAPCAALLAREERCGAQKVNQTHSCEYIYDLVDFRNFGRGCPIAARRRA
jgi:hypothetical protein